MVKCNLLQEAVYNAKQHIMYPAAKFWQVPHTGAHKKPAQKSEYRDDHLILAQQRGYCIVSWTHQPDRNVMCYSEGQGGTAWTEMSRFCLAPAASPLLSWCNSMCERSRQLLVRPWIQRKSGSQNLYFAKIFLCSVEFGSIGEPLTL